MRTISLLFTALFSLPALADVPFRIDCINPVGEQIEGYFTLLTQPDPEGSRVEMNFKILHLLAPRENGVEHFMNYTLDPKKGKKRFWQGESQDFYEISYTDSEHANLQSFTFVLEGDLIDLVDKTGAGIIGGIGRVSVAKKNSLNSNTSMYCTVKI